jgi:hypothetical protein
MNNKFDKSSEDTMLKLPPLNRVHVKYTKIYQLDETARYYGLYTGSILTAIIFGEVA